MLGDEHIYGDMPEETVALFKTYGSTPFNIPNTPVPAGMTGVGMHNNQLLARALINAGYRDLLFGNHKKYAHILEKDNSMIFVDNVVAPRHYYG